MGNIINFIGIAEKGIAIVKEVLAKSTAETISQTGNFNVLIAIILILAGILLVFGIGIFGTIFWIWMLADCLRRKFKKSDDKIMWMIIIFLLHFIGAGIYYFVIKKG